MYQTQINKGVLRNHFQYDSWKYILGIVLTIFFWSMVTTMSAPKTPDDMKVDIYFVGSYMLSEGFEEIEKVILEDFPELMEINIFNIAITGNTQMDYVGRQQLTVNLASKSGDIFIFDKESFKVWAEQGAYFALDGYIEEVAQLFTEGQLDEYTIVSEIDEEPKLYGLPMDGIKTFESTMYDMSDAVISVMGYSNNKENSIEVIKWLFMNGME